jgi:N-acetylgalactosamine-N,N'-diacetylbacillosaminyl-diphospho-undecaprenol 4-alpha-N-acetylgalactosaminyltransferase
LKKKKILIFINSLESGGAERVVSLLLQHLGDDFEIHLALFTKKIYYHIPEEIKIFDLGEALNINNIKVFLKLPFLAGKLYRYCRDNKIDSSISFLNRPAYINALMKSMYGFKGKLIMCERSHPSTVLASNNYAFRKVSEFMVRYSYNLADLVLTNSTAAREDLIDNFKIKTPIKVIYNPIDISSVTTMSEELLECKPDDKYFHFVAVGGFRKEKNYNVLINSLAVLKDIPVRLIIVGSGSLENAIKQQVEKLDLQDRVIFTGYEKNPFKYMVKADCFVLSSYCEGFPNVLLEALALSLPIVSTDCKSGPREMLAPGSEINTTMSEPYEIAKFGVLAPVNNAIGLANAMRKMYEDKILRETYIARALARAEDFEVEKIKELYRQAFSL